jgi:hypothetical protein
VLKPILQKDFEEAGLWLLGDRGSGEGKRLKEWAESRDVDLGGITAYAMDEAEHVLNSVERVGQGELVRAIEVSVTQALITGIEAERCRRDAEQLPDLCPDSERREPE